MKMNFLIKPATGLKSEHGTHAQCVLDLPRPSHNVEQAEMTQPRGA
jgi:hypothetical protein